MSDTGPARKPGMAEGALCVAAGGQGDGREMGGRKHPPHLKELEEGVQLKKSWLMWRG